MEFGRESEVEVDHHGAGDHIARAGAAMDVADLPTGGWEERIAVVPGGGDQFGQCGGDQVDGVLRQMRVGDVALHTFDGQLAAHRAAPAVLDHVARALHRGGLADDAPVQAFAPLLKRLADHHGAVYGRPFFVAGEQEGNVDVGLRMGSQKFFAGHHHGRERSFHVGGTPPVELAVAVAGHERIAGPGVKRAGGDHVGVAGKHEGGPLSSAEAGPQVGNAEVRRATLQRLAGEPQARQPRGDQRLATLVAGSDGGTADELLGEAQGGGHGGQVRTSRPA